MRRELRKLHLLLECGCDLTFYQSEGNDTYLREKMLTTTGEHFGPWECGDEKHAAKRTAIVCYYSRPYEHLIQGL